MKSIRVLLAAIAALTLAGCSTIMSGTTQDIKVDSNPAGATIFVATKVVANDGTVSYADKVQVGYTPATVRVSRKNGAVIVEKEGFTSAVVPLGTKMNPWMWGDILLTSPLSTSIDTSTGASTEYDPGQYMVELKPVQK